jgi:hypothetical protein
VIADGLHVESDCQNVSEQLVAMRTVVVGRCTGGDCFDVIAKGEAVQDGGLAAGIQAEHNYTPLRASLFVQLPRELTVALRQRPAHLCLIDVFETNSPNLEICEIGCGPSGR